MLHLDGGFITSWQPAPRKRWLNSTSSDRPDVFANRDCHGIPRRPSRARAWRCNRQRRVPGFEVMYENRLKAAQQAPIVRRRRVVPPMIAFDPSSASVLAAKARVSGCSRQSASVKNRI